MDQSIVQVKVEPIPARLGGLANLPAAEAGRALDSLRVPRYLPALVLGSHIIPARDLTLAERMSYLAGRLESQSRVAGLAFVYRRVGR